MNSLENLFPSDEQIPAGVRLSGYLEQREYLVGGKLRVWEGELSPVRSPVFLKTPQGVEPKVIGATPLLTSRESLEALERLDRDEPRGHPPPPTGAPARRASTAARVGSEGMAPRSVVVIAPTALANRQISASAMSASGSSEPG